MSLQNLPKEVVEHNLLPYLHTNDILHLRGTCKWLKILTDDYFRLHGHHLLNQIDFDGLEKTFPRFMQLGFSVSNIHVTNVNLFESAKEFLDAYGEKITTLSLNNFYCCNALEMNFCQSFQNLQQVRIGTLNITEVEDRVGPFRFPAAFRNLKTLRVDCVISSMKYPDNDARYSYLSQLWNFCDKLEHIRHPIFKWKNNAEDDIPVEEYHNSEFLSNVARLIVERSSSNLKTYDMAEYDPGIELESDESFIRFAASCTQQGVEMINLKQDLNRMNIGNVKYRIGQLLIRFQ